MRITIVGTGYVGLVTGTCLANTGNDVTCLDVDAKKIERLNNGECPIYEPGLEEMLQHNIDAGRMAFTTDKPAAYQSAQIIFLCVGTPSDAEGKADMKYIRAAAEDIGQAIENAPGKTGGGTNDSRRKIIVIKSTVPVGTNMMVRETIAAQTKKSYLMASNPEFLKEGAAINDFNKPDRVVIGVDDDEAAARMTDLYEPFVRQGNPIFTMDIPSAEMVKYAANAMLATKISFINEIANLCESHAADIDQVRKGMCADRRIGNQFLYPGLGYGGSCFPKDVLAVISMGVESGTPTAMLTAVHDVNQRQRGIFFNKVLAQFGDDLKGKKFAMWGIAFKPGTDDIREAPSITLVEQLLERGAEVIAFDPAAQETSEEKLGDSISYSDDAIDALDNVDALIICTDWDEFKHPDFEEMKQKMRTPVIFDGRNLYRPSAMQDAGFTYYSVGRKPVNA